jgi:hypothetical protein
VRKTQEVERVRFLAGLRQVPPGKSPEAHDPRLFFCELQFEFSESILQVLLELFGIALVLEIRHESSRPGELHPQALTDSGLERLRSSGSYRPVAARRSNGQ